MRFEGESFEGFFMGSKIGTMGVHGNLSIYLCIYSITSNQILSTASFNFFLAELSHWLLWVRISTYKTPVAAGDEVNISMIFPTHSIPQMFLAR